MHVIRDGSKFPVAQLGPDFLVLDEGDDFEGPAQVILSVDGVTHSRDVQLQCGLTSTEKNFVLVTRVVARVGLSLPLRPLSADGRTRRGELFAFAFCSLNPQPPPVRSKTRRGELGPTPLGAWLPPSFTLSTFPALNYQPSTASCLPQRFLH